jgi:predicted acylesterase/phospholipase RssA
MPPMITHVAFSGGGFCGISYLGVIQFLAMEKMHTSIRHIAGTSVGAIAACVLCMELWDFEHHMKTYLPTVHISRTKMMDIFSSFGVIPSSMIVQPLLSAMTNHNIPHDITFQNLAKLTAKRLIITASCVETNQPIYFSFETTPDVKVMDAVRASCAIPLVFEPVSIGGKLYIDGCVTDNHPIDMCMERENTDVSQVLLVSVHVPTCKINGFLGYLSQIAGFMISQPKTNHFPHSIQFIDPVLPLLPFHIDRDGIRLAVSDEDIDRSMVLGLEETHKWFMQNHVLDGPKDLLQSDLHHTPHPSLPLTESE